jgi:hypothetical protein
MSDIDIAAERAIVADTSPETWQEGGAPGASLVSFNGDDIVGVANVFSERNLRFVIRARTLVPALLDALEYARKTYDSLLKSRSEGTRIAFEMVDDLKAKLAQYERVVQKLRELPMQPGHQLQRSYATEHFEHGRVTGFRECARYVELALAALTPGGDQ